jgi:Protein O-mannosyl-transferase TMEM260-like
MLQTSDPGSAGGGWGGWVQRRQDLLVGAAACLPIAVLHVVHTQRLVGRGDSAEFVIAAHTLGIPHPTGYPVYVWLGRIFSMVPVGSMPYRVGLVSAASASACLLALFLIAARTAAEIAKDRKTGYVCGILAVWMLGLSPDFSRFAEAVEVYALNAFSVMLAVYLAVEWWRTARDRWLYASSLVLGLSLGTHMSNVLFVPVFLALVWLAGRKGLGIGRRLVGCVAMLALGSSQYLYLLIRAAAPQVYLNPTARLFERLHETGTANPLYNWAWFVTGGRWHGHYVRTVSGALQRAGDIPKIVLTNFGVAGAVAVLCGLALPIALGRRTPRRVVGMGSPWSLLLGLAAAQLAYYIAYPHAVAGMVLPLLATLAAFAALGGAAIVAGVLRRPGHGTRTRRLVSAGVALALCLPPVVRPAAKDSRRDEAAELVEEMIQRLPAGSKVDGLGWELGEIVDYYRIVENRKIPFVASECDEASIRVGKCYALGLVGVTRRYVSTGHRMEPYLSKGEGLTLFRVE